MKHGELICKGAKNPGISVQNTAAFFLQMRHVVKLRTIPARRDGSVEKLLFLRHPNVRQRQVLQLEFGFAS